MQLRRKEYKLSKVEGEENELKLILEVSNKVFSARDLFALCDNRKCRQRLLRERSLSRRNLSNGSSKFANLC